MKKLSMVLAFVVYASVAMAATPGDFTGTWEGTMTPIGTLNGVAIDLYLTLEIGCTDGQLTAATTIDNRYAGRKSRLIPMSDVKMDKNVLTMVAMDKNAKGVPFAKYTLNLSDEASIVGTSLVIPWGRYSNVNLTRTQPMVACVVTPPSAG